MTVMTEVVNNWEDDLLDRKQYADFLTAYLERKCVPGKSGIVIALDAPWGLGKSFFVKRWAADVAQAGRVAVTFDAWENDSAEAPIVSFMGELRKSLAPVYEKAPKGQALKRQAQKKTKEVVGNLRRATVPALAIVGKAVLKKATGIGLDDVMDAIQGDPEELLEEVAATAPEALERGLDVFFEKALRGHTERMEAVKAFQQSLEELLEMLHRGGVAQGPLYVFIDELDRCRPDYALRLLEGVKHLFSVKGVAFVVSTNLAQLGNSVGAVYGPAFDGFRYLKRFFDFEYDLPEPTRGAFIRSQIGDTTLAKLAGPSGLDPRGKSAQDAPAAYAVVAEAMELDLRTLQRVIAIADAATTGAPSGARFVALWLFFLAALRHLHPEDFKAVAGNLLDGKAFLAMTDRVMSGPVRVPFVEWNEHGRLRTNSETSLPRALLVIYGISMLTQRELLGEVGEEREIDVSYPELLRHTALDLWNGPGSAYPIRDHATLIAAAGHISRPASETRM